MTRSNSLTTRHRRAAQRRADRRAARQQYVADGTPVNETLDALRNKRKREYEQERRDIARAKKPIMIPGQRHMPTLVLNHLASMTYMERVGLYDAAVLWRFNQNQPHRRDVMFNSYDPEDFKRWRQRELFSILEIRGRLRKRHRAQGLTLDELLPAELVVMALRERGAAYFARLLHSPHYVEDCAVAQAEQAQQVEIERLRKELEQLRLANPGATL